MYSLSVGNSTKPVTLSTVIVNLFVSDVSENLLSKLSPIGPPLTIAPVEVIPLVGEMFQHLLFQQLNLVNLLCSERQELYPMRQVVHSVIAPAGTVVGSKASGLSL